MCGIVGMFDRRGRQAASEQALRLMLSLLRHRGPDEFGILLDREAGLGNARLSILDLAGGSQPIANEDESLWIVFNGEIFNHLELRNELRNRGHQFRTASDTEVVLHLYEDFREDCLQQLNGQFAIAIWDSHRRRLFLARDRLGVRPVFYCELPDSTLLFASEVKAILSDPRVSAELDPKAISDVFTYWAARPPRTVFRGIRELPAGHFLTADAQTVRVQRYWDCSFPLDVRSTHPRTAAEVAEEFRELLIDACRIRLRADVSVGAYLSGGLDSSIIASIVRKFTPNRLVTFSIAFTDEHFDESAFQRDMARHLETEHHSVRASYLDIGRVFPEVIWHAETPLMRTAPAPMFLLSQLVRASGFKVVLTGEGADEFLAGYDIFKEAKIRRFWAQQPESSRRPLLLRRLYRDICGMTEANQTLLTAFFGEGLRDGGSPWYSHAVRWRNNRRTLRFLNHELSSKPDGDEGRHPDIQLPESFMDWEPLARAQYLEITTFLSAYLLSAQGDRMAMAHSVEGRYPYLDVRLVEFCNALPTRLKLPVLREKHLLKAAALRWLPERIRQRPKHPYRAPVHRCFFNEATPDYVRELLAPKCIRAAGIFRPVAVERLVRKIEEGGVPGETDSMALVGVLSTQLVHHLFVEQFRRPEPLSSRDRVKVCQVGLPSTKQSHELQQKCAGH